MPTNSARRRGALDGEPHHPRRGSPRRARRGSPRALVLDEVLARRGRAQSVRVDDRSARRTPSRAAARRSARVDEHAAEVDAVRLAGARRRREGQHEGGAAGVGGGDAELDGVERRARRGGPPRTPGAPRMVASAVRNSGLAVDAHRRSVRAVDAPRRRGRGTAEGGGEAEHRAVPEQLPACSRPSSVGRVRRSVPIGMAVSSLVELAHRERAVGAADPLDGRRRAPTATDDDACRRP